MSFRKRKEFVYDLPPLKFAIVSILAIICGLAWLFYLGGITWKQWAPLKWLCSIPIVAIVLIYLPLIISKIRKHTDWRE